MFIDYAKIHVKSGAGGDGCVSFRREKFIPKGGPNGGDGGKGGDIILEVDSGLKTLADFRYRRHYKAKRGEHGKGSNRTGKSAEDIILKVPAGTVVKDAESGEILADLLDHGEKYVLAAGGKGGLGNQHFATPSKQAPREFTEGEPGEEKDVILELKLLAEVGLVGFPNAGKSTLLSKITASKPKIAGYPFTTKIPNLGIVHLDYGKSYVIADIPGIIEGAHEGKGLGLQFLRHIERTKVLVYLIDAAEDNVFETFITLKEELKNHNRELPTRPAIIALNKMDIWEDEELISDDLKQLPHAYIGISALTGNNLNKLKFAVWELLQEADKQDIQSIES